MKFLKRLLVCIMIACAFFAFANVKVKAEETFDTVYEATVTKINNEENVSTNNSFVMHLSQTDYMTAEWDTSNYKWFNAESGNEYLSVDLSENNLCNFPLDNNLEDYNFEQKILIDNVPLSEYKNTHPYKLVGNMRTRVDTLAIYFEDAVLGGVSIIEILEGCQLPTLARSCRNSSVLSCILITESVKYENCDGTWSMYFEGWDEGVEYDGDEKVFYLSNETVYKNHNATPLCEYTNVFQIEQTLAGGLYKGLALASNGNTQKGYITVLRLINPIKAEDFNSINLRLYTNHKRTIYAYNDTNITGESLGKALESFALDGAVFTTINLTSSLYAEADGYVRTIVFKFNEDGEPFVDQNGNHKYYENGDLIRDQLFFISFNLTNSDKLDLLTKDSFIIVDEEDEYNLTFRFNRYTENVGVQLDNSKVILNGQSVSKIIAECKSVTAKWTTLGLHCQIEVTLPKTYNGESQIKNADNGFSGNSMGVLKGLKFPDGVELSKSYTCHIYATEKILDSETTGDFKETSVLDIDYEFVKGSENLHFKIRFDKKITSSNYYHACEVERWRETDLLAASTLYYDKGISGVFVKNGFKSSLLDCIVIEGKTIGEWHATDVTALTNVQTHYGVSGLEYVDVHFESGSALSYDGIASKAKDGNGITIEIREGLKFMTNCQVKKTQTFVLENGVFSEIIDYKSIHVYYDGSEVQNGASVTVKTAVDPLSIHVSGVKNYQVSQVESGQITEFTITYGEGQTFTFTVTEDSVEGYELGASNGRGFGLVTVIIVIVVVLVAVAVVIVLVRRKGNEKKD